MVFLLCKWASIFFVTGSNGINLSVAHSLSLPLSFNALRTALSIGSLLFLFEAREPIKITFCGSFASIKIVLPNLNLFSVKVPVLSLHKISTPAIDSIEDSFETIAFFFDKSSAPSANVIEKTVGIATGIDATNKTNTNCKIPKAVFKPKLCATMSL